MIKRLLLSAAAVAAITGNAIAYDVITGDAIMPNELNEMNVTAENAPTTHLIGTYEANNTGLIFPAYFAGDGWQSTLKIINTKNRPVVAKVVLFDKDESEEVIDFTVYLSAKDVFVADIKVDSDGILKIISTDDSVLSSSGAGMASSTDPLAEPINSGKGYIEVIPMVTYNDGDLHGLLLRNAYLSFAENIRKIQTGSLNFENGVVKNNMVRVPYVNITSIGYYAVFGTDEIEGALSGYIRITDVVNGKDMITNGFPVWFPTEDDGDDLALVYLKGEKANLLDVAIENNATIQGGPAVDYNLTAVRASIDNLNAQNTPSGQVNEVYLTYGEAPVENMYALITQPYKRIAIQQSSLESDAEGIIDDFWPDATGINNYGTLKLVAHVYDNSENKMPDSQFSPATTPKILITQELGWTGTDITDNTKLPHYLYQAQANGYSEGFVILENSTGSWIPGFVTQMIATNAGGTTVTNWYWPTVRD